MWILCLITIVINCNLYGAWLDNVPSQLIQPDGKVLDVFYSGDEYHNWPHDEDYYTMIIEEKTGYVCWAVAENGKLISTGKPVHLYSPQELGLSPRENISEEQYRAQYERKMSRLPGGPKRVTPSTGTVNELVIFIRFAGESEFPEQLSYYDDMFNPFEPGSNTLKRYYWDASYEQLLVNSLFFPIQTGNTVISYQDTQPRSYFQPWTVSNTNGYSNDDEYTVREMQLLKRACQAIASQVPSDLNIDSDGNGYVDNCNFIVRGGTGAWADLLWPHRWGLYYEEAYIRGKRVWDYNFNIENHMNSSGVSVLAHEFGHSLGAPDLYHGYNPGTPVGSWDLMSNDTNPPQSMSAYTKWFYMNWIPEPPLVTESGTYTLYPNSINRMNNSLRINSPNTDNEYFIVEYRNRTTGMIDSTLPGSGLVVWKIDPQVASWGWGNGRGRPDYEIYAFRQGGTPTSDGSPSNAYFSATSGMTSINDSSNPYTFLRNGQLGGLNIRNIGNAGETISFYVDLDGADPNDVDESFESQTFTMFDWVNDATHPWTITNDFSQHGTHSAVSGTIGDGESSRLELNINLSGGYLQFYVRTSTQLNGDYLRFYVNGRLMESWSGSNDWIHYPIYINPDIYNLAWVYVKNNTGSAGADKVWIDAIGIPDIAGHILYPARNLVISNVERDITLNWTSPFATTVPTPPSIIGYNIYRNDLLLTSEPVHETTFSHFSTGGYDCEYWVTTVYSDGESVRSNIVENSMPYASPTNLQYSFENNGVRLIWEYNYPMNFLTGFRILRNGVSISSLAQQGQSLTYLDINLPADGQYNYAIRAVYNYPAGVSENSNTVTVDYVSDDDPTLILLPTQLKSNYPNPFNPSTTITFDILKDSHVCLEIFNIKGQKVKTLVDGLRGSGNHSIVWDGHDDIGREVNSGIYFYRMVSGEYTSVRKMILLK